jgi:hypothetical protein
MAEKLVGGYIAIGVALGVILWGSYVWPFAFGQMSDRPIGSRLAAIYQIQPYCAEPAAWRVLLWAPSLVGHS